MSGLMGDVRYGRMSGGRARCLGSKSEDEHEELDFGAEIDDFGGKIGEISWMEGGETWGNARSTQNQANPWIKINKTSSKPTNHRKIWGYFWWGFSNLGRNQAKEG